MLCNVQELWQCLKTFEKQVRRFNLKVPKLHAMVHLTDRVPVTGNPALHAVWQGESDNKLMKQVLRNCPPASFESLGLGKIQAALDNTCRKRAAEDD